MDNVYVRFTCFSILFDSIRYTKYEVYRSDVTSEELEDEACRFMYQKFRSNDITNADYDYEIITYDEYLESTCEEVYNE